MKIKHFTLLILVLVLHFPLQGQTNSPYQIELTEAERFQKKDFIRGRLTELNTNSPICFADITSSDKTLFAKSNSKGEFLLSPGSFPTTLKIRKFGYEDETIILDSPKDSVLISLTPLEVHKSYSGNKKLLQYESIFKKALEKFR